VSELTTQTFQDLVDLFNTQFNAVATIPANTDAGSSLGAFSNANALLGLVLQTELQYVDAIARLSTIPDLAGGALNPDSVTFGAPFNVIPLGPSAAEGIVTFSTPSPVISQVVVPVGAIVTTSASGQSGLLFQVIAGGSNYNAGLNGYPINSGNSSVDVLVQCLTTGTIGNVQAGQINVIYGSSTTPLPASVQSVTNAAAFTSGVDQETNAAYKARFTLTVSSGRVASINAILAVVAAVQSSLTYSLGDRVNADLSEHDAYFTVFVNNANTNTAPGDPLLAAVTAAISSPNGRAAGISYQVLAPTLVPINMAGLIVPQAGYTAAQLQPLVTAAAIAFANGIGLNVDTTPTICSFTRAAAYLQNNVPGLFDIQGFTLNGGTSDITANFGSQLVAGTMSFTT
jgi:hypothetical protein